jgi:RND superfamily putative drug exporter
MFNRLGLFAARRHRFVLITFGLLFAVSALLGVTAFGKLQSGGQVSSSAPSSQAEALVASHFGGEQGLVVLVTARAGPVSSPAVAAVGEKVTTALQANPEISNVVSYWKTPAAGLRSENGKSALILAHVKGDDNQVDTRTAALLPVLSSYGGDAATVRGGGSSAANAEITDQVHKDLLLVSVIAVPITVVLLYLAFASMLAALLPLAVAGLAITGTFAELRVLSAFTPVSTYAVDLTIALGLGLAVDYSLLLIKRYREEMSSGRESRAAIGRAVETAGRTIAFSALGVGLALTALLVFPLYFLRSFAYAGIGVVIFAVLGALFVMPALLDVFAVRLARRAEKAAARRGAVKGESRFWTGLAATVISRPVLCAVPAVAALLIVGAPFLHVQFATPDDRVLPTSASAHQVGDALRTQFSTNASSTLIAVSTRPASPVAESSYAGQLSRQAGVTSVEGPTGTYVDGRQVSGPTGTPYQAGGVSYWQVQNRLVSSSGQAQDLVGQVRAIPGPGGQETKVGGTAADLVDQKHSIGSNLPLAIAIIVLSTLLILFLFTGSVLIPLKAVVLNALTLFAVLGLMVWIFQGGHLSGLLGFTPTPTSTTIPPLLFVIAFGLSMDYEVFLISRIKELHDRGATNRQAIAGGLTRSGPIVITAAALLSVTFFAFGLSKISFIQFFGIGTGIAILVDATIVRCVLVPAVMRLAGEAIWWAPGPLRRFHDRFGLREAPDSPQDEFRAEPVSPGGPGASHELERVRSKADDDGEQAASDL